MSDQANNNTGRKVTVVGLGNIGSRLCDYLARLEEVTEITCIDPDVYTRANIVGQNITPADVGRAKASVVAERLRRLRADLKMHVLADAIENIPWGRLRHSDVILGCLDSKAARMEANRIARRLGKPYIDAGVRADGQFARVDVYEPDPESACIECGWGPKDYEAIGRTHSCAGERNSPPATGASAALGALAASIQAIQCRKRLAGGPSTAVAGRQIMMECEQFHLYQNQIPRKAACRCDHSVKPIRTLAAPTVAALIAAGKTCLGEDARAVAVEGKSWVTELRCKCGDAITTLRLQGRVDADARTCGRCGGQRVAVGFGLRPRLELAALSASSGLAALGLQEGDVVTLLGEVSQQYIQLTEVA